MVEGSFEVTTTISSWAPPFDKSSQVVEYIGAEGEEFDEDPSEAGRSVFKILTLKNDFAIIEFNPHYILKKSQFFQSDLLITPQQIKVPRNVTVEFSYMWGHKGTTKKLKYDGLARSENVQSEESQEEETSNSEEQDSQEE